MPTSVNIKAKKTDNQSLIDAILDSRGVKDKYEFLHPLEFPLSSPFIFSDMKKSVEIINNAILNKEKILVWGDFDSDGITSSAILYKTLKFLGADFDVFLPDRINLGHGLNSKELINQKVKNKIKVLITVDCGITNNKEISLMKGLGVKTIVTDHHRPQGDLPNADCIINPMAPNSFCLDLSISDIEKNSYLSGAGVALKLAYALLGDNDNQIKKELLVLSAVGTIADIVPLIGENRIIASYGLNEINNGAHIGIKRLFNLLELNRKIKSDDIAFLLAPRLNASGRLDSPVLGFNFLIEDEINKLDILINKLDSLNKVRQSLSDATYNDAINFISQNDTSIVLFNPEWHIGIIGIVASKLVEKFNLPAFLMTMDENKVLRCSIRSPRGYNVSNILSSLSENFLGFGGHELAGGFSADSLQVDFELLKSKIQNAILEAKESSTYKDIKDADLELYGEDVTFELIEEISTLEPFGAMNEEPVFLFKNASIIDYKTIGKEQNHTSFTITKDNKNFSCLYWNRTHLGYSNHELIDFVFKPKINEFNNEKSIRLITEFIVSDRLYNNNKIKLFDHRQKIGIMDKIEKYVSDKNGTVKVWAKTIESINSLKPYSAISSNIIKKDSTGYDSVLLFDLPPSEDDFKNLALSNGIKALHLMNVSYSKNPNDYFNTLFGMLKYAHKNKNGIANIDELSLHLGLNIQCTQIMLEILEKAGCIEIKSIDKFTVLKPINKEMIENDAMYEIYLEEFNKTAAFKDYLKTANINDIESILTN